MIKSKKYNVIVEETIAYTIEVKATSRMEAEEQVQQLIDDNQRFFDTYASDGETQDLSIYSINEEIA